MNLFNLSSQKWLDLIFQDRNKSYGAYVLRRDINKTTMQSFFIGSVFFMCGILLIKIFQNNNSVVIFKNETSILPPMTDIVVPVFKEQVEILVDEVKPKSQTNISKTNTIKFLEPKIVNASNVIDDVPMVNDLMNSNIGSETIDGDTNGEIIINESSSNSKSDGIIGNNVFTIVEQQAIPKDGLQAFYKLFSKKFNTPELENGVNELKVILQFVVEPDGSFSNILILRDPGFGAGKEAVRVLKTMPKWQAAFQNNRKVRSQFTLPIVIKVQ